MTRTILLIDDDRDDRDFFAEALAKVSLEISLIPMESGVDALRKLEAKEIEPDLVILDLNMPVMNGEEVLIKIKESEILKELPVVILSTSSMPITIERLKTIGAREFYTKPNALIDLISIIKGIL